MELPKVKDLAGKFSLDIMVECGIFFLIGQNRSSNQRSGIILEVQFQNFDVCALRTGACMLKFSFSKNSRGPKY